MRTRQKVSILTILLLVLISLSTMFLCMPKMHKQTYALSSSEQLYLNNIITYEVLEYNEDLFTTKEYNTVFNNITMFSIYYNALLTKSDGTTKDIEELDISNAEKEIVKNKTSAIQLLGDKLEEYLSKVYIETKNFSDLSKVFVYEDIIEIDEAKKNELTVIKNSYIKFWENKIYLSYVSNAKSESLDDETGETLAKKASENIDNCLNKLTALEIYPTKMAYFKEEIEKLPAIIDVKKENKEALNKLKKELDEFYTNYGVHLDSEHKKTVESYKWQVDKSLERISDSDNNWAIFWVILIIGGIAGVVMLVKYFVLPKFKRNKRTK